MALSGTRIYDNVLIEMKKAIERAQLELYSMGVKKPMNDAETSELEYKVRRVYYYLGAEIQTIIDKKVGHR